MKALLIFILLTLLCLSGLMAQDKAVQKQKAMDYKAVSTALAKQASAGVRNAELCNQLGLSYYHQGKTGLATVAFLRALRLNSADKDARNNLEFAINHSRDRELYPEPSFLSTFFSKGFNALNLNLLGLIVLALLILTVFCLHYLLHLSQSADRAVPVMWTLICGLALLIMLTLLILKYQTYNDWKQAVIVESEVNGYTGPGGEYAKVFTVHDGLILQITRTDKDWALVTLPNGSAGWVPTAALEKVKIP